MDGNKESARPGCGKTRLGFARALVDASFRKSSVSIPPDSFKSRLSCAGCNGNNLIRNPWVFCLCKGPHGFGQNRRRCAGGRNQYSFVFARLHVCFLNLERDAAFNFALLAQLALDDFSRRVFR